MKNQVFGVQWRQKKNQVFGVQWRQINLWCASMRTHLTGHHQASEYFDAHRRAQFWRDVTRSTSVKIISRANLRRDFYTSYGENTFIENKISFSPPWVWLTKEKNQIRKWKKLTKKWNTNAALTGSSRQLEVQGFLHIMPDNLMVDVSNQIYF